MFKNKETIIGYVLLLALFIGFVYYQQKKLTEEQKRRQEVQKTEQAEKAANPAQTAPQAADTSSPGQIAATIVPPDSAAALQEYGVFAEAAKGEEKTFVLENDLEKITLTNKGGQIKSVELKKYKTWDKKPLILFNDSTNSLSYQFAIDNNRVIDTKNFYFEPVGTAPVKTDSGVSMAFRLSAGDGKYFEQKYNLRPNAYLMDYNVNLVGLNSVIPSNNNYIDVTWNSTLSNLEQNLDNERRYSALYFRYNQSDVSHLDDTKETDTLVFDSPLQWISYKQQFFNTTLFSNGEFHAGKLKTHYNKLNRNYVKQYESRFTLPYNSGKGSYAFQYYIGPNSYQTLASLNQNVESIIKLSPDNFAFSWIRWITRFIIWVFGWFDKTHLNYGIIILLMTILLKIILHPLTAKSIESAAKMKILAPELAALKEKYGDDQAKIGTEQMKIYQRAGVSPFGGCLPLLIQMPILMAMYYFFPASIELRQQHFLWATDLSSYDSIYTFNTMLPLIGNHISLFTILMTVSSVLQAIMNSQMNTMNQQAGMKYMPYIMPVMLMFMFNSFPAALTYYYLLQNLLGVGHQWIIQKFVIDDEKLRKKIEENKKNPKAASGWQKKLADMQREAQQRNRPKK